MVRLVSILTALFAIYAVHIWSAHGDELTEIYAASGAEKYPPAVYEAVDRRFTSSDKRIMASDWVLRQSLKKGHAVTMSGFDGIGLSLVLHTASDRALSYWFLEHQYTQEFDGYAEMVSGVCGRDVGTLSPSELDRSIREIWSNADTFCAAMR